MNVPIGERFGRLVVIGKAEPLSQRAAALCLCDCGKTKAVAVKALIHGDTRSCTCLRRELRAERFRKLATTHGESRPGSATPEYHAWQSMIQRCRDSHSRSWPRYGGRGISVCDRWKEHYEYFLADMGRKPSQEHSLDRINNDGNYEPGNCRWATRSEQRRNRSLR